MDVVPELQELEHTNNVMGPVTVTAEIIESFPLETALR